MLNSDDEGIANAIVELSLAPPVTGDVAQINIPSSITMDLTGQASFVVIGESKGSNTIVASSLGGNTEQNLSVQADSVLFTSFSNGNIVVNPETAILPDVLLSETASTELTWLQSNVPVADGTEVNFTATRGTLSASSVTTTNGVAQVDLNSIQAGKTIVTATAVDGSVTLNNQIEFEFIAETAATIVAQATPHSISPDGDTSTISVVVKDANGNLVKGKTIDFSLSGVSNGTIFPASAVTNSNGIASTVYTSNTTSSQDGVSITATVKSNTDISATTSLTVADKELFITLGTGNSLSEVDSTSYKKQYAVFVTDVDSTAKEGIVLTVSAVPKDYGKGFWYRVYEKDSDGNDTTTFIRWDKYTAATCLNEDTNVDGVIDVGEDTNNDGYLTPGNVVSVDGEVTTDEQGKALIDIIYAKSFASWVDIELVVSAKVAGTESTAHSIFTLPLASSDVAEETSTPPGLVSPFGTADDCTDAN